MDFIQYLREYNLLELILVLGVIVGVRYFVLRHIIPRWLSQSSRLSNLNFRVLAYYVNVIFILIFLYLVISLCSFDFDLFSFANSRRIYLSDLILGLMIISFSFLANYLFSRLIFSNRESNATTDEQYFEKNRSGLRTFSYVIIVVSVQFIIGIFDVNFPLFHRGDLVIKLIDVLNVLLFIFLARFISFVVIRVFLYRYYRRKDINIGSQYSINQLIRYVIYVIMVLIGLESVGISLKVLWGGLAALLVGIGFGLQKTFADLLAGIIMLFERNVEVGNTIQLNSQIGLVKRIGLRTSTVQLRDQRTLVIPNSLVVDSELLNWDVDHKVNRFSVKVGVAYGTDIQLVRSILLQIAKENKFVESRPAPLVRFQDFGDNALIFELFFWSRILVTIEDVQSDIRFKINELFIENSIGIPFPQREIWIRDGRRS